MTANTKPANAAILGNSAADKYVRAIRNQGKRAYAEHCYRAIIRDAQLPDSGPFNISYMAAQSVRLNLWNLLKRAGGAEVCA